MDKMKITIHEQEASKAAIVTGPALFTDVQAALDLMTEIRFVHGCEKAVLFAESLPPPFFDLKTGLAGEILQKFSTYRFKIAIVGDFSIYKSKNLLDFIYESNKGGHVFFLETEKAALDALHDARSQKHPE